jgi:hypothetical protein
MINSLIIFTIITVIFGISKYIARNQPVLKNILGIMYILLVASMQFYINFEYIKEKCGGNGDYGSAFFNTVIPFIFIFAVIYLLLQSFPSWKMPFSNTIGYLITRLLGIRELLINNILKSKNKDEVEINNTLIKETKFGGSKVFDSLTLIYEDPSLLINSLTPDNMYSFTETSSELFKSDANKYFNKLYDLVILKDIVAEYIWYFLSGLLMTAYSVSNISGLKCNISADEMIKLHRLHVKNHKEFVETENTNDKKIYNVVE